MAHQFLLKDRTTASSQYDSAGQSFATSLAGYIDLSPEDIDRLAKIYESFTDLQDYFGDDSGFILLCKLMSLIYSKLFFKTMPNSVKDILRFYLGYDNSPWSTPYSKQIDPYIYAEAGYEKMQMHGPKGLLQYEDAWDLIQNEYLKHDENMDKVAELYQFIAALNIDRQTLETALAEIRN